MSFPSRLPQSTGHASISSSIKHKRRSSAQSQCVNQEQLPDPSRDRHVASPFSRYACSLFFKPYPTIVRSCNILYRNSTIPQLLLATHSADLYHHSTVAPLVSRYTRAQVRQPLSERVQRDPRPCSFSRGTLACHEKGLVVRDQEIGKYGPVEGGQVLDSFFDAC